MHKKQKTGQNKRIKCKKTGQNDLKTVAKTGQEKLAKHGLLKMIMPENCKPHETIVFFDEIQKCPEIVTKIKFLVDEGSFKYVMSGSLLGVELKGIASAPVGYLTVLRMFPMDFEEFMIANEVSQMTLDMLKEKFDTTTPVDEFIHQKLLQMFFIYLIVGGMPDAVKTYIASKDIR